MNRHFNCGRCAAQCRISLWAQRRLATTGAPAVERCDACGAAHSVHARGVDVISEEVFSLDDHLRPTDRYSAWHIYRTRPYRAGYYHARFSHVDGYVRLYCEAGVFYVSSVDRRPVNMKNFLGWRGRL